MKLRLILASFILGISAFLLARPAYASIPAIQVSPLKYQDVLVGSTSKLGFVDVANPSDATVTLHSEVQAFRQINLSGDLQFYQDEAITRGITVSAADFDLGPREAVRVAFTINPQKLPKGGVYAVIFFSTSPKPSQAAGTVIMQSAKAGTLLILDNGGAGQKTGQFKRLNIPFFQFGNGLSGTIDYSNTGKLPAGIAFNPTVGIKAFWWGSRSYVNGPLIFPGNTRQVSFAKKGNYLGLTPLLLKNRDTGSSTTRFVFAVTGFWRLLVATGLILLIVAVAYTRIKASRKI